MSSRALHDLVRRWWAGELGGAGRLLDALTWPAERLYRGVVAARNRAYDRGARATHPGVPVISIGNLAVGGTGKTPFAAWLLRELQRRGRRPALLHGGYAPDEPALHRGWNPDVPVIAERDRVAAAARARAAGADVLVLDDAFQHRRIARDLDIVLVAAERWSAAPRLLPRGGWREPPTSLGRAGVVVVTRRTASAEHAAAVAADIAALAVAAPVATVRLAPAGWMDGEGNETPAPGDSLVVTAIAEPEAFVSNARTAGAQVSGVRFWPDHHAFEDEDSRELLVDAGPRTIVTTAKDWVKLRDLLPADRVRVLRQDVIVESGEAALMEAVAKVLGG